MTARKDQRATTSDWMELEKQRGISVSSTVLQFEYGGCVVNLLDTPGHKDFSRGHLPRAHRRGRAVMVIDASKGIETQTRKLFEVCRLRGMPIFTFMNKLDRPARPPLELLDELEKVLGIGAFPVNWPLGSGADFKGVYDREGSQVHLFERTPRGAYRAPVEVRDIHDPCRGRRHPGIRLRARSATSWKCSTAPARIFDLDEVRAGRLTPVFFGSAMNNFGVQLLLDRFLQLAPPPAGRASLDAPIAPEDPEFSGFVFKIQANMNPRHRDHVAFIRIVSGQFKRDMMVAHPRTGRRIRLSNSQRLFAQERETVDEAFAGDVVGLVGNLRFAHRRHPEREGRRRVRRDPRFPARVFRVPAQPEFGEVQAVPRRPRPASEGRRGAVVRRAWHGAASPPARGGRPAAIRGAAIPDGNRIRRGLPGRERAVGAGPLADPAGR